MSSSAALLFQIQGIIKQINSLELLFYSISTEKQFDKICTKLFKLQSEKESLKQELAARYFVQREEQRAKQTYELQKQQQKKHTQTQLQEISVSNISNRSMRRLPSLSSLREE